MSLEMLVHTLKDEKTQQLIWLGVAGSSLVLLQSILAGTRRTWGKLVASCIVGGSAAALVGHVFSASSFVYIYCGVAAIMAENILFGLFKASEQFRDNPINVFAQLWRIVVPAFNMNTDKAGLDRPIDVKEKPEHETG